MFCLYETGSGIHNNKFMEPRLDININGPHLANINMSGVPWDPSWSHEG